jgi:hypothetical protein
LAADETPDLAGFADAQQRLRLLFGEVVVFLGEVTVEFPDGTALDMNGNPYDPTIEPTASAQASASARCSVAAKPTVAFGSEEQPSQAGIIETGHLTLIADIADRALIEDKSHAIVRERRWLIGSIKPDGIAGIQRLVIGLREEGIP